MEFRLVRICVACFVTVLAQNTIAISQTESAKPQYTIDTKRDGISIGTFTIELFPYIAPKAVAYFDSLVAIKFYDSLAFHRVVPGFVIQGGDPNSKHLPRETWGDGDPSQTNVPAEFNNVSYFRGVLGAARDTEPNSANSQFFICVANAFSLNAQYTAYGKVLSGMNIVDTIVAAPRDTTDNPLVKLVMFVTKTGTNDSVPSIPAMINPANNANRITLDSNLIWSPVSGAVLYRLEIATDSNFSSLIFSESVGTSSFTLKNVQLGLKKYFWRVYSNNGGHRSAYSPVRSFTTAISIPTLQFPANGAADQPGNVQLRWNIVPGEVSYHLQVATNAIFSPTAIVFDQKGITDTSKQMTGLQLSKKHYWRVAAETAEYEGAFAAQWNFFTGTSTRAEIEHRTPGEFSLEQNYPNPFNPTTRITFRTPESGLITLKVFDVLGKTVSILVNEQKEAGIYTVEFNPDDLVSGMYYYQLFNGKNTITRKMLLLR